jgi:hypothetical protein
MELHWVREKRSVKMDKTQHARYFRRQQKICACCRGGADEAVMSADFT